MSESDNVISFLMFAVADGQEQF